MSVGVSTVDPQRLRLGRLLPGQAPALLPRRDARVLATLDDDVTMLDAAAEDSAEVLGVVVVFAVLFLEGCEGGLTRCADRRGETTEKEKLTIQIIPRLIIPI